MRRLPHDRHVQALSLLAALPGILVAIPLLAWSTFPLWARAAGSAGLLCVTWVVALRARRRVQRPLQTLANLLAALRAGDFSFRARESRSGDPLGEVYRELNGLSELLQQQRLGALEATALLRAVMAEIDVAIFAFDPAGICRLANRAGEQLVGRPAARLLGESADALGLGKPLEDGTGDLLDLSFPGGSGRFEVRRTRFRQGGRPHQLLVLSDLTRPLREEERRAWQRIIRVMGHEINNSLAPIQSLSQSIAELLERRGTDWQADALQGLGIIASRAQALGRFMEGCTRLARMPEPHPMPLDLEPLLRKIAGLEQRLQVLVSAGPSLRLQADPDLLEQALINLVRNAADAALETAGGVRLGWREAGGAAEIQVEDEGPGLPPSGNLFVPFFTTKPQGSGIGLALARQIAEAHGGSLSLRNRATGQGAQALLRLPLHAAASSAREPA